MYQNTQSPNQYSKKISIVNLTSRDISPKYGQNFRPFTIYMVEGNDGIVYETSDANWFSQRRIGEMIDVRYVIETKTGANRKVYSHYKLLIPSVVQTVVQKNIPQNNSLLLEGLTKIYRKIEEVERNIIAKIEITKNGLDPIEIVDSFSEPIPTEANGELQSIYSEKFENSEEAEELKESDLPF